MFFQRAQIDAVLNSTATAVMGSMIPYDPIEVCKQLLNKGSYANTFMPLPYLPSRVNPLARAEWDPL